MGKNLDFYIECMKTGSLPTHILGGGLCNCANEELITKKFLLEFTPTFKEKSKLHKNGEDFVYWGSEISRMSNDLDKVAYDFNSLRQTIVLFIDAMEELGY